MKVSVFALVGAFFLAQNSIASRPCVIHKDGYFKLISTAVAKKHHLDLAPSGPESADYAFWIESKSVKNSGILHLPGHGTDQYLLVHISNVRTNEVIASKEFFAAHYAFRKDGLQTQKVYAFRDDALHRRLVKFALNVMDQITCE